MVTWTDDVNASKENKFLSLEYSNLAKWRKVYIFLRLHKWFDKISQECKPSSVDHDMIKAFLKDGMISKDDISIMEIRGKHFFLISNEATLTAMRICA